MLRAQASAERLSVYAKQFPLKERAREIDQRRMVYGVRQAKQPYVDDPQVGVVVWLAELTAVMLPFLS